MSNIAQLANVPELSFIEGMSLVEVQQLVFDTYTQNYKEITKEEPLLAPADPVTLTLKSIALLCYQIMQYVDAKGRAELLKTAQGAALDNLAALLGLTRKDAERAKATMRFCLSAEQVGATAIPAGTRVRTSGGVYFFTAEYTEVRAGELTADITAEAEKAGTEANGLLPGLIDTLVDPIPYVKSVENTDTSSGGTGVESDDAFTERIYLAPSVYSCAGPKDAYEYHAKAWRNDVAGVKVVSPKPCVVEIYFMLASGELPSQSDLEGMQAYLADENVRPLTDQVKCCAPEEVGYNIQLTYYIARSDTKSVSAIQKAVARAVEEYKSWQRTMGRDINPTELIYKVRAAGAKRVALLEPADTIVRDTQIAAAEECTVIYGGIEDD